MGSLVLRLQGVNVDNFARYGTAMLVWNSATGQTDMETNWAAADGTDATDGILVLERVEN